MFSFFSPDNLFILIILALFTGACFRDLRYGIYLIVFLMPTYLWRTEIFSIPTTLLELMIYVLFLMWLAGKIYFYFKTTSSPSLLRRGFIQFLNFSISQFPRLILGIILLFLGLTISTILSNNIRVSLGIMKGWFIDPLLFFLVLVNTVKTKKQIANLFSIWTLSGLTVAIISLVYLITGNLTYDGRLKAFFLSPNHLAMYLSPPFLMLLIFLLRGKIAGGGELKILDIGNWKLGNWKLEIGKFGNWEIEWLLDNIFQVSGIIIIFISLYFTHSYGAFLGIAAAILYFIVFRYKLLLRGARANAVCEKATRQSSCDSSRIMARDCRAPFRYRSTSLAITVMIVLCLFILSSFLFLSADKFQQIINSNNRSSFHSRLMIWNASREILKDNFIFGIGPGTFQKVYLDYADKFSEPYLEWAVPQPHNIFLAFWLQTGMIGLAGFVLILIWFFDDVLKHKSATYNLQLAIPIILMIYFLIHGLVDTTYWKNDLSLMFWILIGIAAINWNTQK